MLRSLISIGLAVLLLAYAGGVETGAVAQAPAKKPAKEAPKVDRADYRSEHFMVHTDLPPEEAKELLKKLEQMLSLISAYWTRPPVGIIECYVVKDIKKWPQDTIPEDYGYQKIAEKAGVTISQGLGNVVKSTVYAYSEHGIPQHEAVHAYCHQAFGKSGPVWYSEGMANMGLYWRKEDPSVLLPGPELEYLRTAEIKSLNAIVNPRGERTGDSGENYAWRWALCHLLANNPNYAKQFRPLGMSFLTGNPPGVTFESVYGNMAKEIEFEYRFFIAHLENGLRVELISWDWKRKFLALKGGATIGSTVRADRGWQGSNSLVEEGQAYEFTTTGTWQIDAAGEKLTGDGDAEGNGRLEAVIMSDYELSDPFDLGANGTFKAPFSGQLHLRCRDAWHKLSDNKGQLAVKLKLQP
ncbi:MAG: hypothetical protein K8R36_08605 [Planctomycetales bacterium]|nr:hypothetical protein [Planctomycetales bacterium]